MTEDFSTINFIRYSARGDTGVYSVDADKKYFRKYITIKPDYSLCHRETLVLQYLNEKKYPWCPKLYFSDHQKVIITEYCGQSLKHVTITDDHLAQITQILDDLKAEGLQHNDIKSDELLVKDGRVYLVDYAMAHGVNGKSPIEELNKLPVLKGGKSDDRIFDRLLGYPREVNLGLQEHYTQPQRPTLKLISATEMKIGGYQTYQLTKTDTWKLGAVSEKYQLIKDILQSLKQKTYLDIGCSNGLACYLGQEVGYQATGWDHDDGCLKLIREVNRQTDLPVEVKKYSFGDPLTSSFDVVSMFAILHWIYSDTATFGSFTKIVDYLRPLIRKYLVIEWIEPTDVHIGRHLENNKKIGAEPYNHANFLMAFSKLGPMVRIDPTSSTRTIYTFCLKTD